MSVIKMSDALSPDDVLIKVAGYKPKSVLVMWIDDGGEPHVLLDSGVTMQNLAYYNKSLDIWTETILVNGSY